MTSHQSNRRYELDWLRVLAILVVFIYHSTRFFNLGDWHVKNINTYFWVEVWNIYITRWMMPLFFIISGASLYYVIGKSGNFRKFYSGKFLRLMIPVLVASVTHSALQVYLERLTHGQFSGSFFLFLPEYLNGIYLAIGSTGNFAFHGMHLWYLLFLFLFSLICYPLFLWFKRGGQQVLKQITMLFDKPGLIYLWFALPLVIMKALIPQAVLEAGSGGWGFLYYIWFLISGFAFISSESLQGRIRKQRWISLALGVVTSTLFLYQVFSQSRFVFPDWAGNWVTTLFEFISTWCWLLTILGFGMRWLAFDRPVLRIANEGVLPFYILHQTVLLVIGYFVMTWKLHDVFKWGIVFSVSFLVIIALYRLLVCRFDLLRFLFGMKTTQPVFDNFRKKRILIPLHVLYVCLFVFAIVNQINKINLTRTPMPLTFERSTDIVLDVKSIADRSPDGIDVVSDETASGGEAVAFKSGANQRIEPQPKVYIDFHFQAPAGKYTIWLRGKTIINNGYTDSVWLQVDDQIGTRKGSRSGNWLDIHPTGVFNWAGDSNNPVVIELKSSGEHSLRIQPRQTPHLIDQVWLSRFQHRIPNTNDPIK